MWLVTDLLAEIDKTLKPVPGYVAAAVIMRVFRERRLHLRSCEDWLKPCRGGPVLLTKERERCDTLADLGETSSELACFSSTREARTSAGKTTLLVQIAHHVAIHHGPVLFVSLEMKPELLFDRILAGVANVSVNRLALRTLYADERQRALSSR